MPCICRPPLEIHKHLMRVSWVAACLTLLTTLSYCHTPHRTAADCGMTARWQLCLRVCVRDHTSHAHTLSVCTYRAGVRGARGSVFRPHVRLRVRVRLCRCSTWLSSAWAGQSLICHPLRSTDVQPKQTDIKTERKASLCSAAVQFVLTLSGALSSPLILMNSRGIRLWRPASQWGAGRGGGRLEEEEDEEEWGVTSIHPHKHPHKQWIHLGAQTLTCLSRRVLHSTVSTVTEEIDFEAQEDGTMFQNTWRKITSGESLRVSNMKL